MKLKNIYKKFEKNKEKTRKIYKRIRKNENYKMVETR